MEGSERIRPGFADVWRRSRPEMENRVATIAISVKALEAGDLDPERAAAIDAAHKLAGVLGAFGLDRGTELARSLEEGLEAGGPAGAGRLARLAAELRSLVESARVEE
jgi:HPt (histidine-containing phosphotransfer) domain-containing protein